MAKLLARARRPVKPDAGRKLLTLGAAARKKGGCRLLILQAADHLPGPYQACQQGEVGRRAFIEAYRTRSLSLPASVYEQQKPFSPHHPAPLAKAPWRMPVRRRWLATTSGSGHPASSKARIWPGSSRH